MQMQTNFYSYEPISKDSLLEFLRLPLPSEIKRAIYEEHFKKAIIYNKKYDLLMKQVESVDCQRLNSTKLACMVKTVIENPNFLEFVRHKNELFSILYREHYIENNKYFKLMDQLNSLTFAWLMYLYH